MRHAKFMLLQLGNMFTLRDDVVPGYDAPTVITELHAHLQDMAVEYRLAIHSVQCFFVTYTCCVSCAFRISFTVHVA